jgi:hypothetical protein
MIANLLHNPQQVAFVATALLFAVAVLGLTDVLLYHTVSHGIRHHARAKGELVLHALRGPTYAFLFALIPFFEFRGLYSFLLAGVLAMDVLISIVDFWLEGESRRFLGGLPSGEYVLHMIIAMIFGAFLCVTSFQLFHWIRLDTELLYTGHQLPLVIKLVFPVMAVLVFVSGLQDAVAAIRLVPVSSEGEEFRPVAKKALIQNLFFVVDPEWRSKIFAAGCLIFVPFVGWPMLLGYRKHVISRLWSGKSPILPSLRKDGAHLLMDGIQCVGVLCAFMAPSVVILLTLIKILSIQHLIAPIPLLLVFFGFTLISPLIVPCVAAYLWVIAPEFTLVHFLLVFAPYFIGIFILPSGFLQVSITGRYMSALYLPSCLSLVRKTRGVYMRAWWDSIKASILGHSVFPFSPWGIAWAYLVIINIFNRVLVDSDILSERYRGSWFEKLDTNGLGSSEAEYQGSLVTLRFPALRDTEREWSECTALRVGGLLLPLPKFVVGVMRSGVKKTESLNPSDELKSQESL